ncbi:MAG: carbamoyltransferase N-terminal domain-containing protein, partial [Thermoanaerobaculia bacterium]
MAVILGINAFHSGASAALVVDGRPVAAVAEERLNRVKYYANFPALAIRECLRIAGLELSDVEAVAVGRDSAANLSRKLRFVLQNPSRLLNLARWQRRRTGLDDLRSLMARELDLDASRLHFRQFNVEHHLAHVASAYYCSPWERSAGFSADGSGDFATCMFAECNGSRIEVSRRVYVPHSLGSLYTMVCEFIGYGEYGDEGKVMGLAPLGRDTYRERFLEMLRTTPEGIELGADYFVPFGDGQGLTINERGEMKLRRHYSPRMTEQFGVPRERHGEIAQRDRDLACGLQRRFEDGYLHLLNLLHAAVPCERVAMAGGCALNGVANGKLFAGTPFTETWIQPAAGDEGLSLGAALYVS